MAMCMRKGVAGRSAAGPKTACGAGQIHHKTVHRASETAFDLKRCEFKKRVRYNGTNEKRNHTSRTLCSRHGRGVRGVSLSAPKKTIWLALEDTIYQFVTYLKWFQVEHWGWGVGVGGGGGGGGGGGSSS